MLFKNLSLSLSLSLYFPPTFPPFSPSLSHLSILPSVLPASTMVKDKLAYGIQEAKMAPGGQMGVPVPLTHRQTDHSLALPLHG